MSWTFVTTGFFEENEAVLKTGDLALQRGYAAFDYFRTKNNHPLFLDAYLDRFFNSASAMFIDIPFSKEAIADRVRELIEKNNIPESGVRLIATGGYSPDSYTPVTANLVIQQQPITLPDAEKFEKGVKVMTHEYQRDLPGVKSINYLMGVWLQKQLQEQNLDDVLYYQNNIVTEFPRANVFIVTKEGKLATPAENVLHGITRKNILEFAGEILPVEVRPISVTELKDAAEVFMTSTTKRLLPVVEIDGGKIGDGKAGPITSRLYNRFLKLEEAS